MVREIIPLLLGPIVPAIILFVSRWPPTRWHNLKTIVVTISLGTVAAALNGELQVWPQALAALAFDSLLVLLGYQFVALSQRILLRTALHDAM